MKKLLYTLLLIPFLFSCDDNNFYDAQQYLIDDKVIIQQYIADNNLDAQEDNDVFYIIEEEGTGTEFPNAFAELSMAYTGYLLDGTEFDMATAINPLNINLSSTITGWKVGIPKFKKGGKGKLIIPSPYAYANSSAGIIPANSILIFDIELLDFTN